MNDQSQQFWGHPVGAVAKSHTPGPWVWLERPGKSPLNAAHGKVLDYVGCEGMWPAIYDDAIDAANMRLIAAAPELLAALKAMERATQSVDSNVQAVASQACRAAINKAEAA